MEVIEKTGATVEEAIAAGLKELGADPSQVMVEVIQEPDQGIMGQGARPAIVRILLMGGRPQPPAPRPAETRSEPRAVETPREERRDRGERGGDRERRSSGERPAPGRRTNDRDRDRRRGGPDRRDQRGDNRRREAEEEIITEPAPDEIPPEMADAAAQLARQFLAEILQRMGMTETQVGIRKAEATRPSEETHWILNISGRGMNRLIAHRGEVLASLQYLVRLMVSRQLEDHANIIVDASRYKEKRSERLHDLAIRMADRAVAENQTITLEPMPPNERRIIHLALRERDDIETKSVGEGKSRKVTISPVQ